MSEGAIEAVELPRSGDAAFGALMDVLAPSTEDGSAQAPGTSDGAAAGAAADAARGAAPAAPAAGGQPAAAGTGDAPAPVAGDPATLGTGAAAAGAAAPADGGQAAAPESGGAADASSGDSARPASWTASAADLAPQLAELSTSFETRTQQAYQAAALEDARKEYPKYFDALEQHPRLLVGQQVPAIGKDGMETLRDAEDAKDWQEAVKHLLVGDIQERTTRAMDEQRGFIDTIHASIDLFKNNADLVPNTKDFDVDLANRFTEIAEPYELKVDGKFQGYTVPVQPLIDKLRAQLSAERAAAAGAQAAAPAAAGTSPTPAAAAAPAAPAAAADPPQAGIPSKAGNSGEGAEDFSTLWGTLGLPNITI